MATTQDFMEYLCEQLAGVGELRYRKMFGEYMLYVDDRPVVIVCDNTPYVKQLDCIAAQMHDAKTGCPYQGAREHYILDVEDPAFAKSIVRAIADVTPLPKKRQSPTAP